MGNKSGKNKAKGFGGQPKWIEVVDDKGNKHFIKAKSTSEENTQRRIQMQYQKYKESK